VIVADELALLCFSQGRRHCCLLRAWSSTAARQWREPSVLPNRNPGRDGACEGGKGRDESDQLDAIATELGVSRAGSVVQKTGVMGPETFESFPDEAELQRRVMEAIRARRDSWLWPYSPAGVVGGGKDT